MQKIGQNRPRPRHRPRPRPRKSKLGSASAKILASGDYWGEATGLFGAFWGWGSGHFLLYPQKAPKSPTIDTVYQSIGKFELKFELINTQSWFINPIYIIVVSIPFQFIYNIIKDKLIGVAGSLELLLLVTLTLLFHMHNTKIIYIILPYTLRQ